jgi:vacuolar-type H+-ATPase subunit F/Vma7
LSVVALGEFYVVNALRAAGVDGREVRSVEEAESEIDLLVKEGKCKVLLVTERLANDLERKRNELSKHRIFYPVFVAIPELSGKMEKKTTEKLYQLISQAVGARLKLGEE